MKSTTRVLAFLGAIALCLGGVSSANAAPNTGSANGQGTLDNGARHFSFSAKRAADGTVSVRERKAGDIGVMSLSEFKEKITAERSARSL